MIAMSKPTKKIRLRHPVQVEHVRSVHDRFAVEFPQEVVLGEALKGRFQNIPYYE